LPVNLEIDGPERWTMTTIVSHDSFAQSPPIRVRAIFPTYAKSTAALARADCRHTPRKI
jgi:hypothetical protein